MITRPVSHCVTAIGLLLCALCLTVKSPPSHSSEASYPGNWSSQIGGLEARLVLEQEGAKNGVRMLVPYLEIQSRSTLASPLIINMDSLKVEVLDASGEIFAPRSLLATGTFSPIGNIALPRNSFIRIYLGWNWGAAKDAAAQIVTVENTWPLESQHRNALYLVATLRGEDPAVFGGSWWKGVIKTPPLQVNWKD